MFKKALTTFLIAAVLFSNHSVKADSVDRGWEDEIIYSLLIDRFQNGDTKNDFDMNMKDPLSFQGGDFQGIMDQLDYLEDMGFTTIQLSSIITNEEGGYHGEWVTDYEKIDERFGTLDEFKKLIEEVHKRDMKLVVEFEANQIGNTHPWISDQDKSDWIMQTDTSDRSRLNLKNDEVQQYLIEIANTWIEKAGFDGYSLTIQPDGPMSFYTAWANALKSKHDDKYLLAFMADFDGGVAEGLQRDGFDSVADGRLNEPLRDSFAKPNGSLSPGLDVWNENVEQFPEPHKLIAYFDNKWLPRYTQDMVEAKEFPGARWKLALTYLYTQPEIPFIYYGTEIAVNGGLPPENRALMNFRADKELIDYITRLGELRQGNPVFSRGAMDVLYEKDGMTVFKREYEGDVVVVGINNTVEDQRVVIDADKLADDKELRGIFGTDLVRSDEGKYTLHIPRETAEIYRLMSQSSVNIPFVLSLFAVFIGFGLFMYIVWKRGKNKDPYKK